MHNLNMTEEKNSCIWQSDDDMSTFVELSSWKFSCQESSSEVEMARNYACVVMSMRP